MLGGALVAFGVIVLGALNTLTQNPHVEQTNEAGAVTAEPLIAADIRAYVILLGLGILLLYGLYKVAQQVLEFDEPTAAAPADD
jgi:TRAP-type C4-dicarboxylate transport system permease small subunit